MKYIYKEKKARRTRKYLEARGINFATLLTPILKVFNLLA